MSDKPEALVLADIWRHFAIAAGAVQDDPMMRTEAELRRLHTLCDEMGEALGLCLHAVELAGWEGDMCADKARAALSKWKESK